MLNVVIVDDEEKARGSVKKMIETYTREVRVVGEAGSVQTGIQTIRELKPEVVLLDIQMPDGSGFDLLQQIDHPDVKIIFITAYEEYAIKAFKFSALDYLLKPLDPDELTRALEFAGSTLEKENARIKLEAFMANYQNMANEVKKIVLKTAESIHLVQVSDIIRCEATGNYTKFFFASKNSILVSRTLKKFDEMLNDYGFFRVHQSHLVNLNHILQYEKGDGGSLILTDQKTVPVATRKKELLLRYFREM